MALCTRAALAGGVEKLESEELPSLVEALGSLRDPEQASSAAAQISVRPSHPPHRPVWNMLVMALHARVGAANPSPPRAQALRSATAMPGSAHYILWGSHQPGQLTESSCPCGMKKVWMGTLTQQAAKHSARPPPPCDHLGANNGLHQDPKCLAKKPAGMVSCQARSCWGRARRRRLSLR